MFVWLPWRDELLNLREDQFEAGVVEDFEVNNCGVLTEEDFAAADDDEEPPE